MQKAAVIIVDHSKWNRYWELNPAGRRESANMAYERLDAWRETEGLSWRELVSGIEEEYPHLSEDLAAIMA